MKEEHLNEDQIIVAIVDEGDLTEGLKRHLRSCPLCREQKRLLVSQLEAMGAMAKDLAPRPKTIPLSDPRHWGPGHWNPRAWRRAFFRWPVFASGLACFVIIAGLWGLMLFQGTPVKTPVMSAPGPTTGQNLAGLVFIEDLLEESALPDYYLDITVSSPVNFGDEFLEFVFPMEEADDSA